MIVGVDAFDNEHRVVLFQQFLLAHVDGAQPFGTRAFEEFQVICVIDDAAGVGVFIVDTYVPGKD